MSSSKQCLCQKLTPTTKSRVGINQPRKVEQDHQLKTHLRQDKLEELASSELKT